MQAIGVASLVIGVERLQLLFNLGEGSCIQQLAEIGAAEDFLKLRLIDRERLRAALGERSIAIVDVVGDIGEQEGRREG